MRQPKVTWHLFCITDIGKDWFPTGDQSTDKKKTLMALI